MGAKRLEETPLSRSLDSALKQRTEDGFIVVEKTEEENKTYDVFTHDAMTVYFLRQLTNHLGPQKTNSLLLALLTGTQLVVRGPQRLVHFLFHLLKVCSRHSFKNISNSFLVSLAC